MLIAVMGLPGSGKSYFAHKLAGKLKAIYIGSDQVREKLDLLGEYSTEKKGEVYEQMIKEMTAAVRQGKSIVLDATFYRKSIRTQFIEAASSVGQTIIFIEIQADEELIKERISQKRPDSEADYAIYVKIKADFEPLSTAHLILHSGRDNIELMIDEAYHYIQLSNEQETNR